MKKLYIIAHTWRAIDLTISTHKTNDEAIAYLNSLTEDGYKKINAGEDFEKAFDEYMDYRYNNEREWDYSIEMEIITL